MKKLLLAMSILTMCAACENPVSKKIKETKEQVNNTKEALKEINEMQDDIQELKKVTPLTNEELKAWLPDEVKGMKRTGFKAGQGSYMQIAMIEGTYNTEDKSKKFKVEVMDGAGEMGAAATAGMRILFSQEFEEEDEYRTRRTVTKNGMKAVEEYEKRNNRSTIQVFYGDRFYINAKGSNMDMDETWEAIEDLDLKDLG